MPYSTEYTKPDAGREGGGSEVLLDPGTLKDLQALDPDGSANFLAGILETFFRNTDNLFKKPVPTDPLTGPDMIRRAAHYLKSSAGSVGARRLSVMCGALETAISNGADVDLEQCFVQIRSVYLETRDAFKAVLEGERA